MAKKSTRTTLPAVAPPENRVGGPNNGEQSNRVIVLMRDKADPKTLTDQLGVAHAGDFEAATVRIEEVADADAVVFEEIGVAVMTLASDQDNRLQVMSAESGGDILAMAPERIMYALQTREYWQGYRDGVTLTRRQSAR